FPDLSRWAEMARNTVMARRGVLIGETGVLSTCVHVLADSRPGLVTILQDSDAGRVFYHRRSAGQVYHLDVFHADAEVDHRRVARNALQALQYYTQDFGSGWALAHYVDVQTATGGGRLTGRLNFGRKASLRRAHRNHVHLAILAPPEDLPCIFYLLAGVEEAITAGPVELRRLDGLMTQAAGTSDVELPMDAYADMTDSFLKGDQAEGGRTGSGHSSRPGCPSGRSGPGGAGADLSDDHRSPRDRQAGPSDDPRWSAVDLAESMESPDRAFELLEVLAGGIRRRDLNRIMFGRGVMGDHLDTALDRLEQEGRVDDQAGRLHLTARGRNLLAYFTQHRREIQLALRKTLRRLTQHRQLEEGRSLLKMSRSKGDGPTRTRTPAMPDPRSPLKEIAWPESLLTAAGRTLADAGHARTSAGPARRSVTVQVSDLRVVERRRRKPVDVCLLIDASASMSGERMRAAKTLVRHLLLSTRDKVAVVVFQERHVRVGVPFTRNHARVETGLAGIRPYGLTPLAAGLEQAADFVIQSRPRNPLLLMITDGIPTVPHHGKNPLEDALAAAARWHTMPAAFACIGLQPNERYLSDLVQAAGGALHVVDELDADTLVAIATAEREKHVARQQR
ncbi:MAG: VWA domain-containing protein, partial [Thermaerobacterales bacterium]